MFEELLSPEVISSIIAIVVAIGFGTAWAKIKQKFSDFRSLIVSLDDALKDNTVTEEEYQKIWDAAKKLFSTA